jgi:hypothetical protein
MLSYIDHQNPFSFKFRCPTLFWIHMSIYIHIRPIKPIFSNICFFPARASNSRSAAPTSARSAPAPARRCGRPPLWGPSACDEAPGWWWWRFGVAAPDLRWGQRFAAWRYSWIMMDDGKTIRGLLGEVNMWGCCFMEIPARPIWWKQSDWSKGQDSDRHEAWLVMAAILQLVQSVATISQMGYGCSHWETWIGVFFPSFQVEELKISDTLLSFSLNQWLFYVAIESHHIQLVNIR